MAKITNAVSFKGIFDHGTMRISEYDKKEDSWTTYSLSDFFSRFDGKEVTLNIKEDTLADSSVEEDGE